MGTRKLSSPASRRLAKMRALQVCAFFLAFYLLSAISLMIPLRPKHSDMEHRDLARFPKLTWTALSSGSFFDDINLWFSDTFPFRDGWMTMNASIKGLYGFSDTNVHGDVQEGDEIPDGPMVTTTTQSGAVTSETTTTAPTKSQQPSETIGALLVTGDSAYEYYNFKQSLADQYILTVNRAAEQLKGVATVYDVLIPTSMEICVDESVRSSINTSDQKKAIQYMYNSIRADVKKVDAHTALSNAQKNGEYLFFRTDHHWTARGAYRTYEAYCAMRGVTPTSLSAFEKQVYTDYLGSFYRDTQAVAMKNNPDEVEAFVPPSTNEMKMTDANGQTMDYKIITDVTTWSELYKYNTFIGGDNPISVIENPTKTDGSACILIKESFGNAFAPFLVEDYQTVYIVDYRYFNKVDNRHLAQLVTDTGAKDVIFMNNISATRTDMLVSALDSFVG